MELRVDGATWEEATYITDISTLPAQVRNVDISDGTHVFRVKAIDNVGNYSEHDAEFALTVRNVNTFKNIILDRDDVKTGEYTLTGLTKCSDGRLIDPWNTDFDDLYDTTFDDYWWNTLDSIVTTEGGEPQNLWGMTFEDIWDATWDDEYDAVFESYDIPPTIVSGVIDTYHVGLTGINYIFEFGLTFTEIVFEDIWDKTFDDVWDNSLYDIVSSGKARTYIRFSDDKTTWTDWQLYLSATYDFRYIQYKIEFDRDSDNEKINVTKLQQYYDVPDITYTHSGTTTNGVDTLVFDTVFYSTPTEISCVITDGTVAYPVLSVTTTGYTVKTYNLSGALTSANYSLTVKGW